MKKKMEIEKFIRENLDSPELGFPMQPKDEDRFLSRFQTSEVSIKENANKIHIQSSLNHRKFALKRILTIPVAASFLLLLSLGILYELRCYDESPDEVYLNYQAKIHNIQVEILNEIPEQIRDEAEGIMKNILFDPVTIIEQLPEEMSSKDKVHTYRKYYEQKIDGLNRYRKRLTAQNYN